MLSYRHCYHAGNFADVIKHLTLIYLLDYLNKKEKPYTCLDTHSGAGCYALQQAEAQKTGEYHHGIAKIWSANSLQHPLLRRFRSAVQKYNPSGQLALYPGSPAWIQMLTRKQDHILLNELHPQDHLTLVHRMQQDPRIHVEQQDAYALLKARLPLLHQRGLVLVDPSYELKEDYPRIVDALVQAYRRFATGVYALWYPVIQRTQIERWCQRIQDTQIPRILRVEYCPSADASGLGMTGSGMILINPPYTLADDFRLLLPELDQHLSSTTAHSSWMVRWLQGEAEKKD